MDADGKLLAVSMQALELRESGYATLHYFPREEVRMGLFIISEPIAH
ncbi:DUF427 domain-containing protein [Halomonas sp. MC140]|nr:DUF427 domain-containing protein [Halomonas sp. MC140]MDN7132832.1 DUF427 domain-containing protein [Halomonas sp. MC140]